MGLCASLLVFLVAREDNGSTPASDGPASVANIWGNLKSGGTAGGGSEPYPSPHQVKTYALFMGKRFAGDMVRAPALTDGHALARPTKAHYLFYKEQAAKVLLDLSGMSGQQSAVAVDTRASYKEISLGKLKAAKQTWTAPKSSDWALAVGKF